jgi:hypothetical protein
MFFDRKMKMLCNIVHVFTHLTFCNMKIHFFTHTQMVIFFAKPKFGKYCPLHRFMGFIRFLCHLSVSRYVSPSRCFYIFCKWYSVKYTQSPKLQLCFFLRCNYKHRILHLAIYSCFNFVSRNKFLNLDLQSNHLSDVLLK